MTEPGDRDPAALPGQGPAEPLLDLTVLACSGVPGCDAAGVSVRRDGRLLTVAASSPQARGLDDAQYSRERGPCVDAMDHDRAVLVHDYATDPRWPLVGAAALDAGIRSSLSLPLRDGRRVLGALNMYGGRPGSFGEQSQQLADVLVRQAAAAMCYLEMLGAERTTRIAQQEIAETLQRSLLPELPVLPGMTCAARYLAGTDGAHVGGDWYDVFALPDGAVGVAVGDVMGHDVEAAAAMGQLRSVLRSYAYEGGSPSSVLDRLDRLVQGFDMAQIATAVYGRLILDRHGGMLLFCNAGHPPPLLRLPDGSVRQLDAAASRLIGISPDDAAPRSEAGVLVPAGSTLLLYTDGLVERGSEDVTAGVERLRTVLERLPRTAPPEGLCDRLLEALLPCEPDDDVALLALRVG